MANVTGMASLAELRKEFTVRGWHRKATTRVVSGLLLNFAIALAGIYIFVLYDDLLVRVCAMILSTAGSMGVGTNTHTSSHYATSEKRWVNEFLTFFGYPVFLGLSACYWWHQHVVIHHPAPNVIGVDDDADLAPWFARTKEEVQRSTGLRRFFYEKLQFFVFPLALGFNGFNMQKSGWTRLIGTLCRQGRMVNKRHWIDLGAMILHYIVWMAIPMIYFAPADVLGFYVLRTCLMGYAMFTVLAPGHFPQEAVCFSKAQKDSDYLLVQTAATVNFRTGVIGKLICSGLEYQIEHLFPNISHVYYPKMAGLVRGFCLENGLPYRCYEWDVVIWKCLLMLRSPSPVQANRDGVRVSLRRDRLPPAEIDGREQTA
jgi:fatty acid desaturase